MIDKQTSDAYSPISKLMPLLLWLPFLIVNRDSPLPKPCHVPYRNWGHPTEELSAGHPTEEELSPLRYRRLFASRKARAESRTLSRGVKGARFAALQLRRIRLWRDGDSDVL